ncbi:MAG: ABC transporter permease [Clostridia bacterium]|nr:ABC transporter permease [Clostridia bacterium]
MKKLLALVRRNVIEMLRDPLTVLFCVVFPVVMLVFMQILFQNIAFAPENFQIENYAAGICVFGYSFTGMFVAMSIAGDKSGSLIKRIEISPVRRITYFASFLVSGLPVALGQTVLFFLIALVFGLPFDFRWVLSLAYLFPSALFYLSLGGLLGALCKNEKQTGPINSILVSLTGILGGVFMPVSLLSGGFAAFVKALPFCHTVQIASELYKTGAECIFPHIFYVFAYTALIWVVLLIAEKLKKLKK